MLRQRNDLIFASQVENSSKHFHLRKVREIITDKLVLTQTVRSILEQSVHVYMFSAGSFSMQLSADLIDGRDFRRIFFLLSTKEIDGLERETEMQISERFARANSSCRDDNANEGGVNLHNDL